MGRLFLLALACAAAVQIENLGAQDCPPIKPLNVGPDSIANIPTQAPLRVARMVCPTARQVWREGLHVVPALLLSYGDLDVVAWQNRQEFASDSGADMWVVKGRGGVLRGGLSTQTTWGRIKAAYGPFSILQDGEVFQILPCGLRGVVFWVGRSDDMGEGVPSTASAEAIPDTAQITELWVTAGANRALYLAKNC